MGDVKECPLMTSGNIKEPYVLGEMDYEIEMDSLASQIGYLRTMANDIEEEGNLKWLVEVTYHLSACLRKPFCLTPDEMQQLIDLGNKYNEYIPRHIVLPVSQIGKVCYSHVVRSSCRKILVLLHKYRAVDDRLFQVFESMSNYFFGLSLKWEKSQLTEFNSRAY